MFIEGVITLRAKENGFISVYDCVLPLIKIVIKFSYLHTTRAIHFFNCTLTIRASYIYNAIQNNVL